MSGRSSAYIRTIYGEWPCWCGAKYAEPDTLIQHYIDTHRTGGNRSDVCPVCHNPVVSSNMRRHLSTHDLSLPDLPRGRKPVATDEGLPPVTRRTKAVHDPIPLDGLVMAVLESLFPKGLIPLSALEPVSRWREATEKFLQEISLGG